MKKNAKHSETMNANELARATKEFDAPFFYESARKMTPAERIVERELRRHQPKRRTTRTRP